METVEYPPIILAQKNETKGGKVWKCVFINMGRDDIGRPMVRFDVEQAILKVDATTDERNPGDRGDTVCDH